jgi:hypothetical protein
MKYLEAARVEDKACHHVGVNVGRGAAVLHVALLPNKKITKIT